MATTLKETLDHVPGGLLITDQESRVLYASAPLERRTGFSIAEIVGKKPGQLWGGQMRWRFYRSLWRRIAVEKQAFVGEVRNKTKQGAWHDEHIFIVPIRDRFGSARYFAEVHPDLRDREAEVAFGRAFLKRTKYSVQNGDFFAWLFQVLSRRSDGLPLGAEKMSWQEDSLDPVTFLEEAFIVPMQQQFARRKEDAVLITRAQEDPERFAELFRKYICQVRQYFDRRLENDRALAEDLAQEVFVRAFRSLPTFRLTNASYATYLFRIAHNVLVNYYRTQRRQILSLSGHEESIEQAEEPVSSEERSWEALFHTLPETERSVMLSKYRDGLKAREIAERLQKTENAVKLILSRTRKKLKERLR